MALTRRRIVLLEEEDDQLLERMAAHQGMATSTLARSMILDGMTRYGDILRQQEGTPSDTLASDTGPSPRRIQLDGRSRRTPRRDEQQRQ